MQAEKATGIVLRSTDYGENQKIFTLFTQEAGLISLIAKGLMQSRAERIVLATPFCEGEYLYRRGRSSLFFCLEASVLRTHLALRHNLGSLQTAAFLAKAILASQMPGKPAPLLYVLLASYLKQIPLFPLHAHLKASFSLKLLQHEGLFSFQTQDPSFTDEEWPLVVTLASVRTFAALCQIPLPAPLCDKIVARLNQL